MRKVLNFSPSFQDNVMKKKWHRERHLATVTHRLSTETCSASSLLLLEHQPLREGTLQLPR